MEAGNSGSDADAVLYIKFTEITKEEKKNITQLCI